MMLPVTATKLLAVLGARQAAGTLQEAADIRTRSLPKVRSQIARIEAALRVGRSRHPDRPAHTGTVPLRQPRSLMLPRSPGPSAARAGSTRRSTTLPHAGLQGWKSRQWQDRDHTRRFPELATPIAALPADELILAKPLA
jgi:hypothetical protein